MNLVLSPCPNCSSSVFVERPDWRYASNTSLKRGFACYSLTGCRHVEAAVDVRKIRSDPEEMAFVSEEWARVAEELFKVYTERWEPAAVEAFRIVLEDRRSKPDPVPEFSLEGEKLPKPISSAISTATS